MHTSTMVYRHRHSQPNANKDDLPTFNAMDDGSKAKFQRFRHSTTITLSQAVLLAAVSASLAAVLTAFGASHYLMDRFDVRFDSSQTTQSSFSRQMSVNNDTPTTNEKLKLFSSFGKIAYDSKDDEYASLFDGRIQEPEFLPADAEEEDNEQLKAVWLMSFPNSGTSFTIHLTREASNTTTATNYGLEGEIKDKPSVPVFNSSLEGPFFELIPDRTTNLPPKYILTKTHCGGYCADCHPQNYIESTRSFQLMCQSGIRGRMTETGLTKDWKVTYDAKYVKKAIHILRNPLDNVVARFHLMHKRENAPKSFTTKYAYNSTGFNLWCADQDKARDLRNFRLIDNKLADKLDAVPCRQEFFMYLQWHNLAFETSRALGLPTLILYYEDYSNNFDLTEKRLLKFLELPSVGGVEPFAKGKVYEDYYSPEQRAAIVDLSKHFATAETWNYLKHYLD